MKLINHPHVLGLYDVYENNTHLYVSHLSFIVYMQDYQIYFSLVDMVAFKP